MECGENGFFLLMMIGQSLVGRNAASENEQNNRGQMEGMQGERAMKESSWVQMNQRISRQEEKKCRSRMQKESTMVRCALVYFTERFSVEHGEEIHEKVQKVPLIFSSELSTE